MSGMESGSGSIDVRKIINYLDGTAFVVREAAKICGGDVFGSVQGDHCSVGMRCNQMHAVD
ncbi:hypothetical protein Pyn_01516 [Prunus yedoensis var. nudiflora]|uniref:Uncharacterized protein n=1 Tax=Prunus yedoensis var. nudiflora TaxID=2094558 RepID=A0A315ACV4_PRUYE|nr:hypothetical protein Pyn_01516 [Prunus yedoensis var. nudiflora]